MDLESQQSGPRSRFSAPFVLVAVALLLAGVFTVMALSSDLLEMAPIGQDRILPLNAIPMRINLNAVIDTKIGKASWEKTGFEAKQENSSTKVAR